VTLNDRQDYLGQTVAIASRVQGLADPTDILATQPIVENPEVARLVSEGGYKTSFRQMSLRGVSEAFRCLIQGCADPLVTAALLCPQSKRDFDGGLRSIWAVGNGRYLRIRDVFERRRESTLSSHASGHSSRSACDGGCQIRGSSICARATARTSGMRPITR
jgi:hypothetical protein